MAVLSMRPQQRDVKQKPLRLNDSDRSQWIDNYEPLYCLWLGTGLSKFVFINKYRSNITAIIRARLKR